MVSALKRGNLDILIELWNVGAPLSHPKVLNYFCEPACLPLSTLHFLVNICDDWHELIEERRLLLEKLGFCR